MNNTIINNKNDFQKFLVKVYKKDNLYTYLVFDKNLWNEMFLDSLKWKNQKLLLKKIYDLISKKAHKNKNEYWLEYSSHTINFDYDYKN